MADKGGVALASHELGHTLPLHSAAMSPSSSSSPNSQARSQPVSRSGTPVNGGNHHTVHHGHPHAHPHAHPGMYASPQSSYSSSSAQHSPDAAAAAQAQAAMMQAAFQQQQQHFQSQVAAMLAAGYTQHQLVQLQPPHLQQHHDPRRRAPSLPNSPAGGSQTGQTYPGHAGQFGYPHHPGAPTNGSFGNNAQMFQLNQQFANPLYHNQHAPQQPYYHPQFDPSYAQHHHHPQHQYTPHPQQPYAQYSPSSQGPPSPLRSASPHRSQGHHPHHHSPAQVNGKNSPGNRERAPTAPSSYANHHHQQQSQQGGHHAAPFMAHQHHQAGARPASPGLASDPSRRRTESSPNETPANRKPLIATMPSSAPQPPFASVRTRTGSAHSDPRQASIAPSGKPALSPSASMQSINSKQSQPGRKPSADPEAPTQLPRIRTESGFSASSAASSSATTAASTNASSAGRPESPASSSASDRAPTPTQALHRELAGSAIGSSGRTTPIASSSPSAQQQQQKALGLAPSIKLAAPTSSDGPHQYVNAVGNGIQRKASPLSQQSSTYREGHRSITPTQASSSSAMTAANGRNEPGADSDDDDETTEENVPLAAHAARAADHQGPRHRHTTSTASSALSSPQTPSSAKSGSGSSAGHGGTSLFRNKLRKALSLNELNNSNHSSSTLSSADTSSGSKKLGRSSLTSNSSSSDTSHSTAGPRTPPNGVSPVMPHTFASASASNLHAAGIGEQPRSASNGSGRDALPNGGSLPSTAGRRFGILNSKMNSSTDNISISSTVSSASMMLRKMGNFGKIARKSSVRSLSNLFHRDKHNNNNEDDPEDQHHHSRVRSDAVSEFGVPGAAMVSSKDRKKASLADPSVAHVTVELERGEAAVSGMTPAEAMVRKHQEAERRQREEEEAARARAAAAAAATAGKTTDSPSPRSKAFEKEKERLKSQGAATKKAGGKKWGFGAFQRSSSSTSLRQEALNASISSTSSSQGAERAHPQRGYDSPNSSSSSSANASPIFDSSTTSSSSASPVIYQPDLDSGELSKPLEIDFRPSLDGVQLDAWRKSGPQSSLPTGATVHHGTEDFESLNGDDDEGFDDHTPRQSMEILGDQSGSSSGGQGNYSDWDGEPPNASFFEDDTASFTDHTSRSQASKASTSAKGAFYLQQEHDEYSSDSGADGRNGQVMPKQPPRTARPAKGILKYARSYSQEALHAPQPAFTRPRASSYDAPHQTTAPNQPGKTAALAQYIPTGNQLDGVGHHPPNSSAPRLDTRTDYANSGEYDRENNNLSLSPVSSHSFSPGTSPYSNPSLNTSEPILSNMKSVPMAMRSVTGPMRPKRNISFAQNLSVHTTWSGSTYDRRGDVATCNRLTPLLAQRIKEELNAFKMEEMEVHHMSRNHTHFFV